jgi:hypothetical protein
MPSLQSYTILLRPGPDRSIIKAMDNSSIHLKSIHLDALDDEMDIMNLYCFLDKLQAYKSWWYLLH